MSLVIVLNGTSSSGKTTIARALQEAVAPRIFLNFSVDNILSSLPRSAIDRIISGADISDLGLPELIRAFYACTGQLLDLGHDLIIDHAITAQYHADLLAAATERHRKILVGLDCPPELLRDRERRRGDRRIGLAEQQHAQIHTLLNYDLMIDTSAVSPPEAAAQILEMVRET